MGCSSRNRQVMRSSYISIRGGFFGLNRTGLIVWKALERGATRVAAAAARWPDVDATTRRRDVDALVAALIGAGLATAPAPPSDRRARAVGDSWSGACR